MTRAGDRPGPRTGIVRIVVVNLFVLGAVLAFMEGCASFAVIVYRAIISEPVAERRHTEHDPLLGWIHRPGAVIHDMYGAGRDLTINHQGLRSRYDFATRVPQGKLRVVCSGDSFTLGNGVADQDTWCYQLSAVDPGIEPVNMGQGGYGLDQTFLWYRRDGTRLEHDVHLFTFITEDIFRMGYDTIWGHPKPFVGLDHGRVVVLNQPVPAPGVLGTFYRRNLNSLEHLNLARIARKIAGPGSEREARASGERYETIVAAMLRELEPVPGGPLRIVVHLPMLIDYTSPQSDHWRTFFRAECARHGLPYVDLIEAFRELAPQEVGALYISAEDSQYVDTPGHLNEAGNRLVAKLIMARLGADPDFRARLERAGVDPVAPGDSGVAGSPAATPPQIPVVGPAANEVH